MTGLLSVREVAERLAVSRKTVYRLLERGDLPSVKIGWTVRVHPDDLAEFIKTNRKGAA